MSDITEFLLARIAEDEAVAREAGEPDTFGNARTYYRGMSHQQDDAGLWSLQVPPARVLAECTAKRALLARWDSTDDMAVVLRELMIAGSLPLDQVEALAPFTQIIDGLLREERDALLRLLALPYAHHPDYREEWRP